MGVLGEAVVALALQPVDRPAAGADPAERLLSRTCPARPANTRSGCWRARSAGRRRRRAAPCSSRSTPTTIARAISATTSAPAICARVARQSELAGMLVCGEPELRAGRQQRPARRSRRARSPPASRRSISDPPERSRNETARSSPAPSTAAVTDTAAPTSCSRRRPSTTSVIIPIAYANNEPRENVVYRPEPTSTEPAAAAARIARGRSGSPHSRAPRTSPIAASDAHRVPVGQRLLEPSLGGGRGREVQQTGKQTFRHPVADHDGDAQRQHGLGGATRGRDR